MQIVVLSVAGCIGLLDVVGVLFTLDYPVFCKIDLFKIFVSFVNIHTYSCFSLTVSNVTLILRH